MRQAGLEGRCKKRWRKTTVADPDSGAGTRFIQRHFGPCEEMDRRYVGDITYISTWEGWAYLATVIDLASRRSSAGLWPITCSELVEDALTMAFANRAPEKGVIFHSDRGCQYTGGDFAQLARDNGVVLSVGRKGECWDNTVAESFFATIKRELIDHAFIGQHGQDFDTGLRVHRGLVQHPSAALDARLPQPLPIRSTTHNRDPGGTSSNTSNLSVEPDRPPLLSVRSVAKAKGPYVSAEVHSFEVSPKPQFEVERPIPLLLRDGRFLLRAFRTHRSVCCGCPAIGEPLYPTTVATRATT